ncbi:MAG: hypothetical protein HUJ94_02915, partial [Bacteroidales bacterium]|nr:hypothetical protein [Bacteroidales bacterium]
NGFSINNFLMNGYSQSASFIGKSAFNTSDYYNAETADFNYERFNADFFDHASSACVTAREFDEFFTRNRIQNYNLNERMTLKYSGESIEVNIGGSTRLNKSWYTVTETSQKPRWNNQISASFNWTAPAGITVAPEYRYNWYVGYSTDQPAEHILNATLSKLLFKDQFTLSIIGYDILNQSKNLTVTDNNNFHQEVRNNTLGRYIILSLTYRFGNFAKAGQNMKGPGGPGGHGPGGPGGHFH